MKAAVGGKNSWSENIAIIDTSAAVAAIVIVR